MFKPNKNTYSSVPNTRNRTSKSVRFRQLCDNFYYNHIRTHQTFPITKYTPTKKSSGNIYYLRLEYFNSVGDIVTLYKIGYTSRTVAHRITTIGIPSCIIVTVVSSVSFGKLLDCYNIEQLLHNEYVRYRYRGVKLLENGNSELYVKDVLGLD